MTQYSHALFVSTMALLAASLHAFLPATTPERFAMSHVPSRKRYRDVKGPLRAIDNNPIECYIVNYEEVLQGAKAEVVCTPAPDEYAWFHGLQRDDLKVTDGILEEAMECVQSASPRGISEWVCKA